MLRLRLQEDDLARVAVAERPAPVIELAHLVRSSPEVEVVGRHLDDDAVALLRALLVATCTPGFLQPHALDADEAVDAVASVRATAPAATSPTTSRPATRPRACSPS